MLGINKVLESLKFPSEDILSRFPQSLDRTLKMKTVTEDFILC